MIIILLELLLRKIQNALFFKELIQIYHSKIYYPTILINNARYFYGDENYHYDGEINGFFT